MLKSYEIESDYEYVIKKGILIITDLNTGPRNLLDKIKRVLLEIQEQAAPFPIPPRVIYQDCLGRFDLVLHDGGRYIGLAPLLQAHSLEQAINIVYTSVKEWTDPLTTCE